MNYSTSLGAHDVVSPYTFDYRGTQTVLTKVGRRWCFDSGTGRRCAPTFRQAIVLAKHELDMRETYGTENPSGGSVLAVVLALAAGSIGTYFLMRYLYNSSALKDPADITQAKVNLASIASQPSNPMQVSYAQDAPMSSITPVFTQALAQFQSSVNQKTDATTLAQLQKAIGSTPALPVRTDGVLDPATFDWLTLYANG